MNNTNMIFLRNLNGTPIVVNSNLVTYIKACKYDDTISFLTIGLVDGGIIEVRYKTEEDMNKDFIKFMSDKDMTDYSL